MFPKGEASGDAIIQCGLLSNLVSVAQNLISYKDMCIEWEFYTPITEEIGALGVMLFYPTIN
jgi:hypothetical protein